MRRRIIVTTILALCATVVGVLWFSPLLDVREVRVFGTHLTTRAEVLRAAGITLGEPIARVDVSAAAARVRSIAQVASVDVRRGFPHAIVIEVHERVPIAATANGDGTWSLVDATGMLFQQVAAKPDTLTAVEGVTADFRGIGARTAASFPGWLRRRVSVVQVASPQDILLLLRSGKQVVWGGPDRAARKAQVLQALLHVKARFYDVSAPDAPATRQ